MRQAPLKTMRFSSLVFCGILAGTLAGAQDASLANPSLGFVYDPDLHALRTIRGILGAALVDEPVDPGFAITAGTISPGQDFALVAAADDPQIRLIRFVGSSLRVQ